MCTGVSELDGGRGGVGCTMKFQILVEFTGKRTSQQHKLVSLFLIYTCLRSKHS